MAHHVTHCVFAVCDRCHVAALNPDGSPRHWPSSEQALAELSGPPWSWAASSSSQICSSCLTAMHCLEHGHDWGDWQSMDVLGEPGLAIRLCARCDRDEVTSAECLTPAAQINRRRS